MLSDYINSCDSIKTTVGGESGRSQGTGDSGGGGSSTSQQSDGCSTEISAASTTCPTTTSCPTTTGSGTSNCQPTTAAQPTETNHCNTVQQQQIQTPAKNSEPKCSFKVFCQKITKNGTCKVLEEIKNECKCECNNICVGSDEICKEFIRITMEQCKKEARDLIIQLNEDLSPELLNTIVLRFIGLQLYLRIIQEFSLLRDYFTKIIENLEKNYNAIKSCTCGTGRNKCSKDGKCLCTIFYKLFKATKSLHDRYCKIIKYMKGESDEDLYKVIPSLSLTRSIILITSYFNDYISSNYMVEDSSCGCGYNVYAEPSLFGNTSTFVFNMLLLLLSKVINKTEYIGLRTCPCHKYSSKLDDVVTLLQTGIEDTDDCDGLLSDVISMISPLVKDEDYRFGKIKTELTEADKKNENAIETKLQEVIEQKESLSTAIPSINGDSSCDGTTASSSVGETSGNGCESCTDNTQTQTETQATTPGCNGADAGSIATACSEYIDNGGTNGCGSTECECKCDTCKKGNPGKCCCFFKCTEHEEYDKKIKECLMKMVGKLNADGIKCNGNGKDCLMCYLCVLKCKMSELQKACNGGTDSSNGNGCNLDQTLKALPDHIKTVVEKICGTDNTQDCCNKCTDGNKCSENGNCSCSNDECCKVNDRYSNFTKFLLGTDKCTDTSTSNNKCKTITKTLTNLNTTLGKFICENGGSGTTSQCTCSNGTDNCKDKCCCGSDKCSNGNECKENKPINILSCVIECGLKGIKERSTNIVEHIEKIEECLNCIDKKMKCLNGKYGNLHKCISELKECVTNGKSCIDGKINCLKTGKENNQKKFNEVIEKSKEVLSDICGLYRVHSIESYSYSLSPYYIPIFPHNKQFILPCINN